jgi:signal peptidase I
MPTASATRYLTREIPMPGDRIVDRNGRLGTVTEVSGEGRDIGYGALAIKWDGGVVAFQYPLAERFGLISRAHQKE